MAAAGLTEEASLEEAVATLVAAMVVMNAADNALKIAITGAAIGQ